MFNEYQIKRKWKKLKFNLVAKSQLHFAKPIIYCLQAFYKIQFQNLFKQIIITFFILSTSYLYKLQPIITASWDGNVSEQMIQHKKNGTCASCSINISLIAIFYNCNTQTNTAINENEAPIRRWKWSLEIILYRRPFKSLNLLLSHCIVVMLLKTFTALFVCA